MVAQPDPCQREETIVRLGNKATPPLFAFISVHFKLIEYSRTFISTLYEYSLPLGGSRITGGIP
eukprot:1653008-Prymnesium_polylepis.2